MSNRYVERRDAALEEARALTESGDLDGDNLERFEGLTAEIEDLNKRIKILDAAKNPGNIDEPYSSIESGDGARGPQYLRKSDPYTAPDGFNSPDQVRSAAFSAVEDWKADDSLKESATQVLEHVADDETRQMAEHILRTSRPEYVSAFRKFAKDPEGFRDVLDPDERQAWADVREMAARAALTTTGAVLPSPLDPSIVLSNAGNEDSMRRLARVDQTTANLKRYITSAGVTASFDAEGAETSDDTPTLTEVTVNVHKAQAFVQASIEVVADQPDFSTEVAMMFADAKDRLEGAMFVTGSGSDQPTGIQVELAGGSSEINAAGEALVANDVYGLIEALPVRFRNRAQWQLELSTRNFIHRLWNPSGTEPPLIEGSNLIGSAYELNSNVDPYSAVDPAVTANNYVLFVGDWNNYIILDRVGMAIEFVPHIFATANNLPQGIRGFYAFWRVGGESILDDSFRMLDVATTA